MPRSRIFGFLAIGALSASCSASSSPGSCVPLATVAMNCAADWTAAKSDMTAFCAKEAPFFDAFTSTGVCRGRFHYTRYLFDGGPRYCLYDPTTLALVGYGASDGKALFEQYSCGVKREDFDDRDCEGVSCTLPDASAPGAGD
jgi:hypothetical protein